MHPCEENKDGCRVLLTLPRIFPQVIMVSLFLLCFVINATLSCKIVSSMMKRKIRGHCRRQEMISAKIQVTRTLVLNNTIFFLCQLPIRMAYSSQILESIGVDLLTKQQFSSVYNIGLACLMFNSSINPFLYVLCCKIYRDAFKQLCCRCLLPRNGHSDQNDSGQIAISSRQLKQDTRTSRWRLPAGRSQFHKTQNEQTTQEK